MTALLLTMVLCAASPGGAATVSDVQLDLWLPDQPAVSVQAEQASSGGPVEIRSERFDLDVRAGTGTFTGAVVVTHGQLVVTCERLEVVFDPEHQAMRSVVAIGGVEIRQGDRLGRGERAELDVELGTVVLSGSPYVEQGSVRLRGTEIRFDVAGGEVACTGCRAVFGEDR